MDEVTITLVLLLIILCWRGLTNADNRVAKCFQKCLHFCGPLAAVLQWYSLLFFGVGLLLARTFYDVVKFEYIRTNFLNDETHVEQDGFIPDLTEEDRSALEISPCLKVFSLCAPAAGVLAGILVVLHVRKLASENAKQRGEQGEPKWALSREMNMVVLVIAMPMVFILMAMRAEIRIWAVMTGSAWLPYHADSHGMNWDQVKTLELATYTTDLELAGFFQYITIFSFGRLCVSYLRDAPAQYRFTLKFAGLQGVYIYVLFGLIRSAGTFAEAVASHNEKFAMIGAVMQEKVLTFIGPIFTVSTIQCVYNMMIICRMDDVKAKLGNANLKFQATRALVLIAQIQQQVLLGLVVGGPIYNQIMKPAVPAVVQQQVQNWQISTYRAKLMHAALLNFECLIVVLMNRCFWSTNYADANAREGASGKPGSLQESLLPADKADANQQRR